MMNPPAVLAHATRRCSSQEMCRGAERRCGMNVRTASLELRVATLWCNTEREEMLVRFCRLGDLYFFAKETGVGGARSVPRNATSAC